MTDMDSNIGAFVDGLRQMLGLILTCGIICWVLTMLSMFGKGRRR